LVPILTLILQLDLAQAARAKVKDRALQTSLDKPFDMPGLTTAFHFALFDNGRFGIFEQAFQALGGLAPDQAERRFDFLRRICRGRTEQQHQALHEHGARGTGKVFHARIAFADSETR
jgi:hypothetical protein